MQACLDKMYKIIYLSSATKPFSLTEINDLLAKAREKNSRLGITGMLIYREGNFIQLIEGDEQAVKNLYSTIKDDSRHKDCLVLDEGTIEKRCFAEWSMNFQKFEGKPIFTETEIGSDDTGNLKLLNDFVVNMR